MAGTVEGGRKAAATNRKKYGKEFYANIGRKGGRNGHTGGFAANPELAKIAGAIGGRKSKRGPAKRGGKVVNASYTEDQLERIRNEGKGLSTLDEIESEIGLLKARLEKLAKERQ